MGRWRGERVQGDGGVRVQGDGGVRVQGDAGVRRYREMEG